MLTFNPRYSSSLKRVNCKPTRIAVAKVLNIFSMLDIYVIKENGRSK